MLKWKARKMSLEQMTPATAGNAHLSSSFRVSSLRLADTPKMCLYPFLDAILFLNFIISSFLPCLLHASVSLFNKICYMQNDFV